MSDYTLKDRIKLAREDAGLSQTEVAQRMGLTRGAVAQWETGRASPSYANLVKFAEVVGRPPALLMDTQTVVELDLDSLAKTGEFPVVPPDTPTVPEVSPRTAQVFWHAAEFQACMDAPAAMQECFNRKVAEGVRADYFDGVNLVEFKATRADSTALGHLLLLEKLIGRQTKKYLLVYSALSPSDEQRRMARAVGVELHHIADLGGAAALLHRLYCDQPGR